MKKYTVEQINEAVSKLMHAHEVMGDHELMEAVKDKMKGVSKIKTIADIRNAASESQKEEEMEDMTGEEHDSGIEPVQGKLAGESKEDHVKNSKRPTVVGKAMK